MATLAAMGTDRQSASALARGDVLAAALIVLVMLATRGIWWGDPVADFDEQLYSFIGWRMSEGELPYVDWWDRKPFGLFAIFALAHAALGPGAFAYQLLAALFALAGAALIYGLVRELSGRFAGAIGGSLYVALMAAYSSYSAQSEIFFVPLTLGMVWLLRDPAHPRYAARAGWAMLLGGLALQVKYTVLPQCLLLGAYAVLQVWTAKPKALHVTRQALVFAALGLSPTMLVALFYILEGELDAFVFANFLSFFERAPASQGRWSDSFAVGILPLLVLVLGGLAAAIGKRLTRSPRYLFYLAWAASSLAGVLLPSTTYLYYYAAAVPAAVLLAAPLLDSRGPGKWLAGPVLLAASLWILALPDRYRESLAERAAAAELAQIIAPHVGRADNCLWLFDGPTVLYRLTGSCVPTRFVYPDHLNNALESEALGMRQEAEVARILGARPAAIVTADRAMTPQSRQTTALVEAALASDYEEALTVPMHGRQITAWVRRER